MMLYEHALKTNNTMWYAQNTHFYSEEETIFCIPKFLPYCSDELLSIFMQQFLKLTTNKHISVFLERSIILQQNSDESIKFSLTRPLQSYIEFSLLYVLNMHSLDYS